MKKSYAASTFSFETTTTEAFRHDTTRDTLVNDDCNDIPPPYTLISGDTNTLTQDDGRVRLDVNSKLARTLSVLIKNNADYVPPLKYEEPFLEQPEGQLPLNIVIQIVGSRGDVQPFIALGNELQKSGHRVRLATHDIFRDFVTQAGLAFHPIGGDPNELMSYMVKNPGLIPSMKTMQAGEISKKREMISEMLEGCWRSCIEPDEVTGTPFVADAIIANPPSFAHIHCAQALCIPVHLMFTMPWTATKSFPHPLANIQDNKAEPSMVNRLSYAMVEWMTWQGLADVVNSWRETMDLEPVPTTEGPFLAYTQNIPTTYCWSGALVPKPADWGQHIDVCGFFFRDMPNYKPPQDLQDFLEAGPTPIYIGFGSIVLEDVETISDIISEAVSNTGVRCILSKGWAGLCNVSGSPNILEVGDCPHEWLFQKVSAVVHHGGAGTAACGLKNGLPSLVCPFFGDQPFWGEMIHAAGAGPAPIHHKSLTPENLSEAIRYLTTPEARLAARNIAHCMSTENGVKAAVQSFHRNLPRETTRCDILPHLPAVWTYKLSSKRTIKLSKLAAENLLDHLKIDGKKLGINEVKSYIIENRRWEPLTGAASAAIGTLYRSGMAIGDGFKKDKKDKKDKKKQKLLQAGQTCTSESGISTPELASRSTSLQFSASDNDYTSIISSYSDSNDTQSKKPEDNQNHIARGFGKAGATYLKGSLVDIPFALAEGLRNAPLMYGDKPRDLGTVTDWKSGTAIAGKGLFYGIYDGITGLVTEPVKGAKKEGAVGALKGFGRGLGGIYWKPNAGLAGLLGYTVQGVYKSVYGALHTATRKRIAKARREEGVWLLKKAREENSVDLREIIVAFEELRKDGFS
ncbi:glycosyltransferase family 1 protein [Aureobasidium subglaciale EXF-2481]|uniref:Glycosyltransferase family 1 protein n=1 Tax=Aureobasidium subglaciale (strain EXF-2481) TaxID=1043005 RepID=A0A074ZB00_AURSE|nr:glycosyltransferase family 1 protein [Aureobasidium subglaciale EXF-2481]KEQ95936.1 glycosyltransferase family 1 protein [Aureobasidium subglaciale EXF-2481]